MSLNERADLVKVLFLLAPFKRHMIERMVEKFSSRLTWELLVPEPHTKDRITTRKSLRERAHTMLLGPRTLREAILKFEPDIVFSDAPLYAAYFELFSILRRTRKPLIVQLRGDWWREFWAQWSLIPKWSMRVFASQYYAYNWAALILANKVAPICRWLEHVVTHNIPRKKTEVVYQGIDPDEFYPQDGLVFEKPAVSIIQNHVIYPKVLGLLRFREVVEKLPNVHFYIAEGEYINQWHFRLVKERYAGLSNVHFVSGINNKRGVRQMLTASDCYVLASGLDCCPTTVLEASLMRKPVIASKVGGVPEIVLENETGWTIKNGSTADWVEKINLVISDSKLNRKIGDKGREWVSENFAWKTIAPQVERILLKEANV